MSKIFSQRMIQQKNISQQYQDFRTSTEYLLSQIGSNTLFNRKELQLKKLKNKQINLKASTDFLDQSESFQYENKMLIDSKDQQDIQCQTQLQIKTQTPCSRKKDELGSKLDFFLKTPTLPSNPPSAILDLKQITSRLKKIPKIAQNETKFQGLKPIQINQQESNLKIQRSKQNSIHLRLQNQAQNYKESILENISKKSSVHLNKMQEINNNLNGFDSSSQDKRQLENIYSLNNNQFSDRIIQQYKNQKNTQQIQKEKQEQTISNISQEIQEKQQTAKKNEENTSNSVIQIENNQKKQDQNEDIQRETQENSIKEQQSNIDIKKQNENINVQKKSQVIQNKSQKNQKIFNQADKKNKKQNVNGISNVKSYLPSNFIVILEKGFSLFTHKFSNKFMQEYIFSFLNPQDCLNLRLVNKELCKRANSALLIKSQKEELILKKKQLKNAYKEQISDLVENEIHDFRQILDSFDEITEKEYLEFLQMVIPPQNLLIVLNIFLIIFGQQTVGLTNLLADKTQWKKVINTCFVQGQVKQILKNIKGKANLKQLYKLITIEIYQSLRDEISHQDQILEQLSQNKNPFLYKLFNFIEKLLDLQEILHLKFPNALKYLNLLSEINQDKYVRILSQIGEKFEGNDQII